MSSTPDAQLLAAHDLALAALHEITPPHTVGAAAGYVEEDGGVLSLRFETTLPGYPGWWWTVSVARVEGEEPTVLEAEMLPGDDALLAPEWVPWAERLAEYHAAQAAAAAAGEAESDDEDDADDVDTDDDDDLDDEDDDAEVSVLHSGDVDGVDIDELDESADDDDSDDEEGDASDEDDASDSESDERGSGDEER